MTPAAHVDDVTLCMSKVPRTELAPEYVEREATAPLKFDGVGQIISAAIKLRCELGSRSSVCPWSILWMLNLYRWVPMYALSTVRNNEYVMHDLFANKTSTNGYSNFA